MRQATGRRARPDPFEGKAGRDWRIISLLRWATSNQFNVNFAFGELEVPEEFRMGPENETHQQWITRSRGALRTVREAAGISGTEMDRRLDQQYSVYQQWESRPGSYQITAIQRAVRALGGEFQIILTHKHNPGLLKRLRPKQ